MSHAHLPTAPPLSSVLRVGRVAALVTGALLALMMPSPAAAAGASLLVALASVAVHRVQSRWWRASRALWLAAAVGTAWATVCGASVLQAQWARDGAEVRLRGRVVDLPVHEARRTRFVLQVDDDRGQPPHLRGQRVRLAWYDPFDAPGRPTHPRHTVRAGERYALLATLRAPRGLRNPGGTDGERHAFVDRVVATGVVRDASPPRRRSAALGVAAWREAMSGRIVEAGESASLRFIRALAIGDTRGLDARDWQVLRATGLTHLIAISGFHVGMVATAASAAAWGLWWLCPGFARHIPRPHAAVVAACVGAAVYTAVAGFALPTVRTTLMILAFAAARLARRGFGAADALAWSVAAIVLADPLAVLSAGFWLSCGGVAWLIWCLGGTAAHPVASLLSSQGVATIGLFPLSAAVFGQASAVGPIANLFAIPWWSLVVVPLALCGTALEAIVPGAGAWAWRLSALLFAPSWDACEALAASPLALHWLPTPAWFALPLALLAALWLLMPRGAPARGLALALWCPLLWPDTSPPADGEVEVVMVDVGQGLAVVVRTARHALLYDTGPAVEEGFDAGERAVVPTLRALGIARLDMLVLSHADNDHAGGYAAVARELPIARLRWPDGSGLDAGGRRAVHCEAGAAWTWDGVRFRFIHPPVHFPYLRNDSSCVLRVEAASGAVLLTGDIDGVVEDGLVRRQASALRAEVVSVPHHGSGSSSTPGFVDAVAPRVALVSAGHANRFRHPRPEVVERWAGAGAAVPGTAEGGALRVRVRPGGVPVVSGERWAHPRFWDAAARADRVLGDAIGGGSGVPRPGSGRTGVPQLSYRLD